MCVMSRNAAGGMADVRRVRTGTVVAERHRNQIAAAHIEYNAIRIAL
jgi:hypothetical protein